MLVSLASLVSLAVKVGHVIELASTIILALLQEESSVRVFAVVWASIVLYLIALVVEAIVFNWWVKKAVIV